MKTSHQKSVGCIGFANLSNKKEMTLHNVELYSRSHFAKINLEIEKMLPFSECLQIAKTWETFKTFNYFLVWIEKDDFSYFFSNQRKKIPILRVFKSRHLLEKIMDVVCKENIDV